MILRPHEVAQAEISKRAVANAKAIGKHVLSIYGATEKAVEHLGSGIVISIGRRFYLMTAAHLLESGRNANAFAVLSQDFRNFVFLDRRFLKSADDGDLAIAGLEDAEYLQLGAAAVRYEDFFHLPPLLKGRGLASIGWPNTKNEISQYKKLSPAAMLVSGPSVTASDIGQADEFDRKFVYQRYRPKESIDEKGFGINPPKLRGLSGGLTVDLGNPLDPQSLVGGEVPKWHPVGILTEFDRHSKVIRSTRPHEFLRYCVESEVFSSLHTY